jgi:hypothetical protein
MTTLANLQTEPMTRIVRPIPGVRDAAGYQIFSHGESGAAHAFAHRMFDGGQIRAGRRGLEGWFAGRQGSGSDWLHLHFHLALFELESGDWQSAYERFASEILPSAADSAAALTDAPGLLWRLAITAPAAIELPWQPLRRTALANLHRSRSPFVQLHNLLAIAGAGDVRSMQRWLESDSVAATASADRQLRQFAPALMALAAGSWRQAGSLLQAMMSDISSVGGSGAQNTLFERLAEWCAWQDGECREQRNAA